MIPIVAIVGRPNVGKSTLFNRLVGKKLAIVDDMPGVTRDRHYADAYIGGRNVTLVDTGGFDPTSDDPMQTGIVRHVQAAIEEADLVLCVLDGANPPLAADREAVELLRKTGKPVLFLANKADSQLHELSLGPLHELGIPNLFPVSALHGRGTANLGEALAEQLVNVDSTPVESADGVPRIALVGRPNAGKSSLFNRVLGEDRALVDDRPGTTRDPVDERVEFEGQRFVIVDTAGIRRRSKVERGVELVSVMRSIRAMERAQVCVLLCDASEGVAEQDARLLSLCIERRRAVVIGLNKMDMLDKRAQKAAIQQATETLRFAQFARMIPISVQRNEHVGTLLQAAVAAAGEMTRRIPTGELNRFFEEVLARNPPPTQGGLAPRIYYVTQAQSSPPVFVAMTNHPEHIKESYQRFVVNQLRKAFGFESVPITVHYRAKNKE
jgi:GTP-binding protein